MSKSCSGCGSRLAEDATQCDLCGIPVQPDFDQIQDFKDVTASEQIPTDSKAQTATDAGANVVGTSFSGESSDAGVFCNQCGWKNPVRSNFCSQCGSKLQTDPGQLAATPPPSQPKPDSSVDHDRARTGGVEPGAGIRMGMLIGLAVLVIFVVYMIVSMGGRSENASPVLDLDAPKEPPLIAEVAAREQQLLDEVEALTGTARIDKQRELLTLYFTARRFDLAGAQAEQIALATGDELAWIDAGNFFYDWMETSEPEKKPYYSQKSTSAYRKALELNPDNLDVRTDMAVAYLYDPQNSMLAIQETMKVLEADSNHVQANFNRGIMLWQINRLDEATSQFEKVMSLVGDPEDPVYLRASEALNALQTGSGLDTDS